MSIIGEIGGLFTGVQDYKHGKAARNVERQSLDISHQTYSQLADLLSDPSQITEMPMYKAGLEAVQRSLATQGLTGSGNAMMALSDYGANYYQQQVALLTELARGGTPTFGSGGAVQAAGAGRFSSIASGGMLSGGMKSMGSAFGGGGAAGGTEAGMGVNQSAGNFASMAALA